MSGNFLPHLLFSILLATTTTAIAAGDSFTGDWTADTAHAAKNSVGLHIATLHIEAEGNRLGDRRNGARPDGAPYSLTFNADCNGRVNGIADSPEMDAAQCWRNHPRTVIFKLIRAAAPREWRTAEVAKNGQSMRITTTVTDSGGKETKSVAVILKK